MLTENEILELMFEAYHKNIGIEIETNDPERLRQKCYALRKGHDELTSLSFFISPFDPTKLWIAHPPKEQSNEG